MAQYSNTTLAQARLSLALRLQDTSNVYWSIADLNSAIVESLRIWQSLTGFYRQRAAISTAANTAFYDLHALLPAIFSFSVTDQQLVRDIQSQLLEPATGNSWTGSDQFTLAQVTGALQRRRDQLLADTGIVISRAVIDVPPMPIGRAQLPQTTIDLRRAAWIDDNGRFFTLWRDDEFSMYAYQVGWTQAPGVPQTFSVFATPPISAQLVPVPANKGQLEILSVNTGPALDPSNGFGVLLSVPDDFSWVVKWGAMAELLATDGMSRDPLRAKYCEAIYKMGIEAATLNPSVMLCQLNDEYLNDGSVFDMDTYKQNWQNARARPSYAGMMGRNMLALGDTPDDIYGMTFDLVGNMPVPTHDDAFLQVGRETLEAILDMSQHICSFKMGGKEFVDSYGLHQNFLRMAATQNARIRATAFYASAIMQPAQNESRQVPRTSEKSNAQV